MSRSANQITKKTESADVLVAEAYDVKTKTILSS